jgi:transcriptional regulator with XRE-family HTH domain
METFGQRLKRLREEKDLTQTQLSEAIGCKKSAISTWENGSNMPKNNLLLDSIAAFFGITAQELQYGTAPLIVNEPPVGYELIPTKEYIEFLKFKAAKGEQAEQKLTEVKNIENVSK